MTPTDRNPDAGSFGAVLGRSTILYGAGHIAARSTYLILVPVLTRALSPQQLGAVDLLTAANAVALSVVSLEINQGLARYVSAERDPARRRLQASTAVWYGLGAFGLMVLLAFLFADPLAQLILGRPGQAALVTTAALAAGANGMFLIIHGQLRWQLRAGAYASAAVVVAVTTLVATVVLVAVAEAGVQGVFLGQLLGSIVAAVLVLWLIRESIGITFAFDELRRIVGFSAPLVPAATAAFVAVHADRFAISRFLGNADVGLYGVGYRIASIVGLAISGFQLALTPLIYSRYEQASTPSGLARAYLVFVAGAVILWLSVSLFAPEIIEILATPEFARGSVVVPYLAGALIINGMATFAPGLAIAGRTHVLAAISFLTLVVVLLLNVALVPVLGIQGAAMSGVAASCVGLTITISLSQRHYPLPYAWPRVAVLVGVAVGALLVSSSAVVVGPLGVFFRLALVGGVAGLAAALGMLPRPDQLLRSVGISKQSFPNGDA